MKRYVYNTASDSYVIEDGESRIEMTSAEFIRQMEPGVTYQIHYADDSTQTAQ